MIHAFDIAIININMWMQHLEKLFCMLPTKLRGCDFWQTVCDKRIVLDYVQITWRAFSPHDFKLIKETTTFQKGTKNKYMSVLGR